MFYTYMWLRYDGTPYYVGKGCGDRAFIDHRKGKRARPPQDVSRILIEDHVSEAEAFEAERFLISYYGRKDFGGILINMTDGGEGAAGHSPSQETRDHLREVNSGWKHSPEAIEKIRQARRQQIRQPISEEQKQKISLAKRGYKFSEEHRRNFMKARWGKIETGKV